MNNKKLAFTLIEIIIVLAVLIIVLSIVTSIFMTGNKVFSDSDVKSTLQIEAEDIQENISEIGMQAIGVYSIEDNDGNTSIKNVDIVDLDYDDLKSKLTDINGNKENVSNNKWLPVSSVIINSYREEDNGNATEGNLIPIIQYVKNSNEKTGKLSVNGKELSGNVESIRIKPINVEDSNATFRNTNSISINIVLVKKKGYSDIKYPISIDVKFRNNFMK